MSYSNPFMSILKALKGNSAFRSVFLFNQYERDRWVQQIAAQVPPGASILDVGAGSAPYRSYFRHAAYKTHDFCQLDAAQLYGRRGYSEIDIVSDIINIAAPDSSFDYILCTEVIEHVPQPLLAIKEMVRLVKPGGAIFISAPLGSGLHQQPFHYYGGYTPYFYQYAFKMSGAEVINISPNRKFFAFFAQETLRFAIRTRPTAINMPLVVKVLWLPVWLSASVCAAGTAVFAWVMRSRDQNEDFTIGYHVVGRKLA